MNFNTFSLQCTPFGRKINELFFLTNALNFTRDFFMTNKKLFFLLLIVIRTHISN